MSYWERGLAAILEVGIIRTARLKFGVLVGGPHIANNGSKR